MTETSINFDGHTIILRPETETLAPSIAFEHGTRGISPDDAMAVVRRFMSALAWVDGFGIKETFSVGSSRPMGIGKSPNSCVKTTHFDPIYLPAPNETKQKLALALYREALTLNSKPYKFLGFAKILNIIAKTRTEHETWINSNLQYVKDSDALKIISDLRANGLDVGNHVYASGRCAIAHANDSNVVDPDSSADLKRMITELPLIKSLAEIVIERELGIKSQSTIWQEHLYELKGFKEKISPGLVKEVIEGTMRRVNPKELDLEITVGLRQKDPYPALGNLRIVDAEANSGILEILLRSKNEIVQLWLGLDFKNERLRYNPYDGMSFFDDGSKAAAQSIQSFLKFKRDLFRNGKLQISASENGAILGYTSAFIPTNIDMGRTIKNFEEMISALDKEVANRT